VKPRRQIIGPVILPLLAAGLLAQAFVHLLRVTVTYEALGQGMGAGIVGLLSAVFSLLPVFLTVQIGRFNDRGYAAWAAVLGTVCLLAGSLILWILPASLASLLVATAVLGVGQTLFVSSLQLIAMISSSRAHRDGILGNYMVAMSLGQAIGPLFLGLGDLIFPLAAAGAVLTLIASLLLLRAVPVRRRARAAEKIPLSRIAKTRGLPWIILTGAICVTALDLMLAFLPVLGEARGVAPATIGLLLSLRAAASMVSRVLFGRAVRLFGRMRLMLGSVAIAGAGLLALALPLPVWGMGLALFAAGFGLGIALTSTIALTAEIAPSGVRGTALSLRLTANRIAQFGLPLMAGLVVAPMGAGGIFALTGAALLVAILSRPRSLPLSGRNR
jgi:MFS family permease